MRDRRVRRVLAGLVVAMAAIRGPSAAAEPIECRAFLRMHGLLRRAAAVCGYATYNAAIRDRARICFDALGASRGASEIYAGAADFDNLQTVRDQDAVCASLASRFPMVVRP